MKTVEETAAEICDRLSCHEIFPDEVSDLAESWEQDPRWKGVIRPYKP